MAVGFGQNMDQKKINEAAEGFACKICGSPVRVEEKEVWDDPGDCAPILDYCYYTVKCEVCHIESYGFPKSQSPTEAIADCKFIKSNNQVEPEGASK